MTTLDRIQNFLLLLLTLLACQGIASAQSLYDVVISLSDRMRVVSQESQVSVFLSNQNNDPDDPDMDLPPDSPIEWVGAGTNPTQSAIEGLGIGEKIALLNQAVAEFDRLKSSFLNSSDAEFSPGSVVGTIRPYTSDDFDPLPRATPENYNEFLRLLAQRVRALRLIPWRAAFRAKDLTDHTYVREVVVYDDPRDSNKDGSKEPRVEIHDQDDAVVVETVTWKPDSIGPGNRDVKFLGPWTSISDRSSSRIGFFGSYSERESGEEEITAPLRTRDIGLSVTYQEVAMVSATAPGGEGTQIDGSVYILRRSAWHEIDVTGVSSKFEETQAGYVVEGSGNSGSISLFGSPPTATVNGAWVTTGEDSQSFVEGGYQYKESSMLPLDDPGYSDDYNNSYEQNWKIGCDFFSVFKPTFTRGVDATGMRGKLESSDLVLADNTADGALLLRPRPGLLFGIDLGPGLKGAGNGCISGGSMRSYWPGYGDLWDWVGREPMARFDSSYSLQFAGSCSDYHVLYENDRSGRSQSLPADSMGWPYTTDNGVARYDHYALYSAWDSPRLKQVAGRDLVADIEYNSRHYGGYTLKVYRRPANSVQPTPGQVLSTSGMTLIRTWTFSHSEAGTTAHPTIAEKLKATGSGGEQYEIAANHIPHYQGLGYGNWYSGRGPEWWRWTEGTWSWTLKLSQGTTEKLKKDIEITSTKDEDDSFILDVALSDSLDRQETSSLSSMTLDPFSDRFPKDWEITSAGKTITGTATMGDSNSPATRYDKLPVAVSIQYDGVQPDATYTWDTHGLLESLTQGLWTTTGTASGDTHELAHKLNGNTYSTTWTEFLDGGNKVKTYSAPDGTAGNKSHASVAWSEVEYGTATKGLPGLPYMVRNSDGTGATYDWNASADGSYILTLAEGLLSGSSVSRGTKLIQNTNARGYANQIESFVINVGTIKTGGTVFANMTDWGLPGKGTDYRTGLESTWSSDNNLSRLSNQTGGLGVATQLSDYDVLGRPGKVTTNGISAANTYNAFSISSAISGSASGSITHTRDNLGRLTASNIMWNGVTDNLGLSRSNGTTAVSHATLLGSYQSSIRNTDGTASSTTGPTLPFGGNQGIALTVEDGLLKTKVALAAQSSTYQTTWTDAWGRICKTETPTGTTDIVHSPPSSILQRVCIDEPSGRKLISETYSPTAIRRSGIDVNGNGALDTGDRYVESTTTVSGTKLVTTLKLTEDTGLREILRTLWNPNGNETITKINGNEETITRTPNYTTKTITTTSTKGWSKTETFNNLGLTTSSNLTGPGIPAASLTPTWRADGSLAGVSFSAGGDTHSATFKNNGPLSTLTAPGKGNILGGHGISGGTETLTVDGVSTTRKLDGTEETTSGGDVNDKTETLTTSGGGFKNITTPAAGAATETALNAAGSATAKNYAAGAGESYGYAGGLLSSVSLARGGSLVYGYSNDGAKDLTTAAWPAVVSGQAPNAFNIPAISESYGHDRAGRINQIGDASGVRGITYQNGRATASAWTSGALRGYQLIKSYAGGRETGFTLKRDNVVIHSAAKLPNDVSNEVSELISGNVKIVIGRNAARQVSGFQWGNASGTFVPAVTHNWQRGTAGRVLSASSNVNGAPSFNYKGTDDNETTAFDLKGRRLKCATTGGEWIYQYTGGQLTSAVHPTLGSFTYQFDGSGRRAENAANTADLLNRTLAWTNTQNKTVRVNAHPGAQVWFNGTQIPNFTGNYNYPVPSPGPQGGWVPWNTLAVLPGQGDIGANADAKAEQTGAAWVPPISESFTYDAAGNRESTALWNYGWNAKNQLVRARTKNYNNPTTPQGYDITNAYDSQGRRFSKKVNRYQNGQIAEQKVITFVWDGNDLIYERHQLPSGLTTCERKYVWGPDISGTQGGAGGAGGLLLIRETKGNQTIDLYPLYDGTGHVIGLSTIIDNVATLVAEYAYGPFGETIYARGPHAQSCPFRYATKYYDQETGLYCYLERPYDPITAQFLSRDPLGEKESLNLYQITGGDPINYIDVNGLAKVALDGKGNLTAIGQIILDIAKGDPNAARSLLMAKQVDAESAGIAVARDGGEDSMRNVMRAIETAVGNAQEDGRDEWKMIAAKAGLSGERYFGGYKDAWMTAKLAEYAPMIAANAGAAILLRAAERAANDKATAYQNSTAYKLREFADAPFDVAAFLISSGAATDVTTGSAVTWNSLNNGGGFGLAEVTPGERVFAASMVAFGPVSRGAGFVDDFVRVGARGRSFAGTALKPWGAKVVTRWGPATGAGPLGEEVAGTFRGGSYTEMLTQEVTTLYRAYGGKAGALSPYWSRTPPAGPLQAQIDSALLPKWGNTAENLSSIIVPKGTRIFEGFVAPQGGLLGGGIQVYIPKVDPSWLVK